MSETEEQTVAEVEASEADNTPKEPEKPPAEVFKAVRVATNFFSEMEKLLPEKVNLTLTITRKDKALVVAVRPQVTGDEDDLPESLLKIKPLVLTHPAIDLDNGFFETVTTGVHRFKTFAQELGAFEEGLKAEKKEEKKPATTPPKANSQVKKKAATTPAKKQETKKPVAKPTTPPKPPEPTPQEKAEIVAKEAEKYVSEGNLNLAIQKFQGAQKLYADPAYAGEIKKLEVMKFRKVVEPTYTRLDKLYDSANYGDLAKELKEISAKDPDNPKLGELKTKMAAALGEGFINKLLGG